MFDKKVQEMLTEIMFEEKAEKWVKDNLHSTEEDYNKAFIDGAKFGYNEKHSELEIELKWERETKSELADHLGKANDKIADLEETINKLREQLSLRYDLENKIKELEEANKANEWHYLKDGDLPKDEKLCLIWCGEKDFNTAEYVRERFWDLCGGWLEIDEVIAWKEIVLPELKESE